jgi:hypothetical protein
MSVVLAFLDSTGTARAVLDTAVYVGELSTSAVEPLHVRDGGLETPETLAARAGLSLRVLDPPPGPALVAALSDRRARTAAIGARSTPGGRQPVGATAQYVLERALKPVFVVPPEVPAPHRMHRALVPLEGDASSSSLVIAAAASLLGPSVELVVLHVFTAATLPAMVDRPEYDYEIVGKEFITRHLPGASRIELRPGPVDRRIREVAAECDAGLVVLVWSQQMGGERARVVRDVLGTSSVPTLLIPSPVPRRSTGRRGQPRRVGTFGTRSPGRAFVH